MKNKRSGHISENELDSLLNKAFLNLDFESNSANKEALAIVTKHAMHKNVFFQIFNTYRLDLLFLLLSIFICLTSFYRYIDPLSNDESQNKEPVPRVNTMGKETPSVILPAKTHSIESTGKTTVKNTSALVKVAHTHSRKRISEHRDKKDPRQIIPETDRIDGLSSATGPGTEVKTVNDSLNRNVIDSVTNVSQNNTRAPSIITNKKTRPAKKLEPLKVTKKGKAGKRKRGKVFGGNGTFRLKGNKYGKSSRL